jgi:hypothetical protein
MPRSDAPRTDRGDDETADQEDQQSPGKPACPVEERNHEEWRVERRDATDVTSSERCDPAASPRIAQGSRTTAAAITPVWLVRRPAAPPTGTHSSAARAIAARAPSGSATRDSLPFVKTMPQMFQCARSSRGARWPPPRAISMARCLRGPRKQRASIQRSVSLLAPALGRTLASLPQ